VSGTTYNFETYDEAISYLSTTTNYEQIGPSRYMASIFKLDRMKELARHLGNPHKKIQTVHIAGTKGKGSVAYMVESMARNAGLRTGLFVSPHVTELTERIQLNGAKMAKADFAGLLSRIAPHAEKMARRGPDHRPTFFELINILAFLLFQEANVDLAVIETGMGGRLDSTNIINPVAGAITSIGLDHTKELGDTLEKIAAEKAGILKPGRPFVIAPQEPEVEKVIRNAASKNGAEIILVGREINYEWGDNDRLTITTGYETHHSIKPGMSGAHQHENAAVAIGVIDELRRQGFNITGSAITRGLAEARAPARFEILVQEPLVIIDGAHNAHSARALAAELQRRELTGRRLVLLIGMGHDKDVGAFFKKLGDLKPHRTVLTRARSPRAAGVRELEKIARSNGHHTVAGAASVEEDVEREFSRLRPDEALCITGSFYVASEARDYFLRFNNSSSSTPE